MAEHLIIIGNGFDLSLGLKTSYSNFINSIYFKELIVKKNSFAIYLSNEHEKANWVDIENELGPFSLYPRRENFQGELSALKKALRVFLRDVVDDIETIDKRSPAYKFITFLITKNLEIIDFNYTEVIPTLFNKAHQQPLNYLAIHGTVRENNIILGTEDNPEKVDPKASFTQKSFADNFYRAQELKDHFKSAQHIHIFGHSLGVTDHDYFLPWFRQQVTTGDGRMGVKKLSLYYHSEESKAGLLNQINIFTEKKFGDLIRKLEFEWVNVSDEKKFNKHLEKLQGYY